MIRKIFRKAHRWLGLALAVQVVAWMASGFYFSLFPIEEIRGEHLTREPEVLTGGDWSDAGDPSALGPLLDAHFGPRWELHSAQLVRHGGAIEWRLTGMAEGHPFTRLADLREGRIRPPLAADEAIGRAQAWLLQPGAVTAVDWVDAHQGPAEFRDRPLSAWRVRFEMPEGLNLYLDPWTGELLARRTDRWRIFDFLWMLHIMDFDRRDEFDHPLLQGAALLGLVIAISGVVLWAVTTPVFRRRRLIGRGSVAGPDS